jgi:hypothetical protein
MAKGQDQPAARPAKFKTPLLALKVPIAPRRPRPTPGAGGGAGVLRCAARQLESTADNNWIPPSDLVPQAARSFRVTERTERTGFEVRKKDPAIVHLACQQDAGGARIEFWGILALPRRNAAAAGPGPRPIVRLASRPTEPASAPRLGGFWCAGVFEAARRSGLGPAGHGRLPGAPAKPRPATVATALPSWNDKTALLHRTCERCRPEGRRPTPPAPRRSQRGRRLGDAPRAWGQVFPSSPAPRPAQLKSSIELSF